MAVPPQKKRLSLDTNVLIDLAAGSPSVHAFKREFQYLKYTLYIVPGVLAELSALAQRGTPEQMRLANIALGKLAEWKIVPVILTDREKLQRQNFMAIIGDREILPKEEINDARILADTGIAEIPVLVTTDGKILSADSRAMQRAFEDSGLGPVSSVNPSRLAAIYGKTRRGL